MKKKILTILTVILLATLSFVVLAAPTTKKQETGMEKIQIEMLEVLENEKQDPQTLEEATVLVKETRERIENAEIAKQEAQVAEAETKYTSKEQIEKAIATAQKNMKKAAKELDFIAAAQFRDEMMALEKLKNEN